MIAAIVCAGICSTSCKNLIQKVVSSVKDKVEDVVAEEVYSPVTPPDPYAAYPKVYSNAYDGFTNIRQRPSSSSQVLSVLKNGPQGAALLGYEGSWAKIICNGVEGYVYSNYITTTPTKEVYVDISTGWLFGQWKDEEMGLEFITFSKNGTYKYENYVGAGYIWEGKWMLEGNEVVLHETKSYDPDMAGNSDGKRFTLDGSTHKVVGWKKGHYNTKDFGA